MAGFAFAFFALEKVSRQVVLSLFAFPLIFAAGILRVLLLFGLVSLDQARLGRFVYYDIFGSFQFVLVFLGLWLIRGLILRWWPFPVENR